MASNPFTMIAHGLTLGAVSSHLLISECNGGGRAGLVMAVVATLAAVVYHFSAGARHAND